MIPAPVPPQGVSRAAVRFWGVRCGVAAVAAGVVASSVGVACGRTKTCRQT